MTESVAFGSETVQFAWHQLFYSVRNRFVLAPALCFGHTNGMRLLTGSRGTWLLGGAVGLAASGFSLAA